MRSGPTQAMRGSALSVVALGVLTSACGDGSPSPTTAAATEVGASDAALPVPWSAAANPSVAPGAAAEWTGPVRSRPAGAAKIEAAEAGLVSASDPGDAERPYVDIESVLADVPDQPHWRLLLSGAPPKASTLDPAHTVISYGVAFETTGDETPDYVVGISNDAFPAGDFRVWVTNLATGATDEKLGPPYGFPVEFVHPDGRSPEDEVGEPGMVFTFLGGSRPPGVSSSTRFYAWASVEEDGTVVAWDYAPDGGWVGSPAEDAATPEPEADAAVPVTDVGALAGFPECQAESFDFAGEGTLRGLGLHTATPVPPPDIDRVGMIWVTHDLMPRDFGEPGGQVEMTRMLCFEFPDGSGGSGWPVDPDWRPPADRVAASEDASDTGVPPTAVIAVIVAVLASAVSVLAFRRRP
jgi:hypothetical protein